MHKTMWRCGHWVMARDYQWRRLNQVMALNQALRVVFPLILLGSLADLVIRGWLTPTGYYYQTLHVENWCPQRARLEQGLLLLQNGAVGLASLGLAIVVSFYLVRQVTRSTGDQLTAGLLAGLTLQLVNVNPVSLQPHHAPAWLAMNLGWHGILAGLVVGLLVGNLYRIGVRIWSSPLDATLRPITLGSLGGLGVATVSGGWLLAAPFTVRAAFNAWLRLPLSFPTGWGQLASFSLLNGAMTWCGALGALPTTSGQTVAATQNLAAVLGSAHWQVPHVLTVQTVIQTYASMGGPGMALALLLAIFLVRQNAAQRRIGWLSLVPVLGNFNAPLLVGLPVIWRPLLGIPLLLAPLACVSISSLALAFHWVPATAYPLAVSTPGPFLSFLGSGGSLRALLLAIVNLALATAIYYPFVKGAAAVDRRLAEEAKRDATSDELA